MSKLEDFEVAVLATLQSTLPGKITAENASHSDGVSVPSVTTWLQGIPVDLMGVAPEKMPVIAVSAFQQTPLFDDPADERSLEPNASLVETPIEVVGLVYHATSDLSCHKVQIRMLEAVKAAFRAQVDSNMGYKCAYWPYALEVAMDPIAAMIGGGGYIGVFGIIASRARILEGR